MQKRSKRLRLDSGSRILASPKPADSDSIPDEIWKKILRNIAWQQRFKLETVCRRFYTIMPYDDLGIIDLSTDLMCLSSKALQSTVELLITSLFEKSHRSSVAIRGIISKDILSNTSLLMFPEICPFSVEKIDFGEISTFFDLVTLVCLGRFPNLLEFTCCAFNASPWQQRGFASGVPKLRKLRARGWCPLTFPHTLRDLSIIECPIDYLWQSLAACPVLETLILEECDKVSSVESFPSLPLLRSITLEGCNSNTLHILSTSFANLKKLTLFNVNLVSSCQIEKQEALEELSCEYVSGVDSLLSRCASSRLTTLSLKYCQTVDATLEMIGTFGNLRVLIIFGGSMTGAPLTNLFVKCQHLTLLSFTKTDLDSAHFASLAYAPASLVDVYVKTCTKAKADRALKCLLDEVKKDGLKREKVLKLQHSWAVHDVPADLVSKLIGFGFHVLFD